MGPRQTRPAATEDVIAASVIRHGWGSGPRCTVARPGGMIVNASRTGDRTSRNSHCDRLLLLPNHFPRMPRHSWRSHHPTTTTNGRCSGSLCTTSCGALPRDRLRCRDTCLYLRTLPDASPRGSLPPPPDCMEASETHAEHERPGCVLPRLATYRERPCRRRGTLLLLLGMREIPLQRVRATGNTKLELHTVRGDREHELTALLFPCGRPLVEGARLERTAVDRGFNFGCVSVTT